MNLSVEEMNISDASDTCVLQHALASNKDLYFTCDELLAFVGLRRRQLAVLILCSVSYFAYCSELMVPVLSAQSLMSTWTQVDRTTYSWLGFWANICSFLGGQLWGWGADGFGRRPVFTSALAIASIFGFVCAFSPSWSIFILFRCFTSFGVSGVSAVDYLYAIELMPPSYRSRWPTLITTLGSLGVLYSAGLAWGLMESLGWRYVVALSAIPLLVTAFLRLFVSVESPRFLLSKGREKDAWDVFEKIHANKDNISLYELIGAPKTQCHLVLETMEKTTIEIKNTLLTNCADIDAVRHGKDTETSAAVPDVRTRLKSEDNGMETYNAVNNGINIDMPLDKIAYSGPPQQSSAPLSTSLESKPSLQTRKKSAMLLSALKKYSHAVRQTWIMFHPRYRRQSITLAALWFLQSLGYWGITAFLPSYYKMIGLHPYGTFFMSIAVQLPGLALSAYLLKGNFWFQGRKSSLRFFAFGEAACMGLLAILLATNANRWATMTASLFIYFFCAPIWNILYIYTPENFPTAIRATGFAVCSQIGAIPPIIAFFVSAYILKLSEGKFWLYPVIWSVLYSIVFVVTLTLTHETSEKPLTDITPSTTFSIALSTDRAVDKH